MSICVFLVRYWDREFPGTMCTVQKYSIQAEDSSVTPPTQLCCPHKTQSVVNSSSILFTFLPSPRESLVEERFSFFFDWWNVCDEKFISFGYYTDLKNTVYYYLLLQSGPRKLPETARLREKLTWKMQLWKVLLKNVLFWCVEANSVELGKDRRTVNDRVTSSGVRTLVRYKSFRPENR